MYVDRSQIRDEIHASDQPSREDDTNAPFRIKNEGKLIFLDCNL